MNLRGREEGARPEMDTLASLRAVEGGSSRSYVVQPPAASSVGSADSTQDSPAPAGHTPSCASLTPGGETCCEPGSPASPSTTTYEPWGISRAQTLDAPPEQGIIPPLRANPNCHAGDAVLIFSAEGFPVRTSASPAEEQDSLAGAPAFSTSSPESPTLFDLAGYSSRTYPASSPRTAVGTSESCLERWPTSGTAWPGGFSTAVSSECRSDADGCSSSEPSLTEILEPPLSVPGNYSLSGRAARGILRRAEKRGRTLPGHLAAALESVAGPRTPSE
jgi:hypothetical protein